MGKPKGDSGALIVLGIVMLIIIGVSIFFLKSKQETNKDSEKEYFIFGPPIPFSQMEQYTINSGNIAYNLKSGTEIFSPLDGKLNIIRPSEKGILFPDGVILKFTNNEGNIVSYYLYPIETDLSILDMDVSIGQMIGRVGKKLPSELSAEEANLLINVGNSAKNVEYSITLDKTNFRATEK